MSEASGVLGWVVIWWRNGEIHDSSGVFWSDNAYERACASRDDLARMWKGSDITLTVAPVGSPESTATRELRHALANVIAHTGHNPGASNELLTGLLAHIREIAARALSAHGDARGGPER